MDWIEERKKLWRQESEKGFSWKEKNLPWSESDDRRNYERSKDDYLRRMQGKAKDLTKDVWARVMSGEYNVEDFQSYLSGQTGMQSGHTSGHYGSLTGTWGQWGGYDTKTWGNLQTKEKLRQERVSNKKLQPGAYEQTRGDALLGMNKNRAKKTLMGQY